MKVRLTRQLIGEPIPIKFGKPVMETVGRIVEASVLDNIAKQKQADGKPLKKNKPVTIELKLRKGMRPLSLVADGHRLVKGKRRSFKVEATVNNVRIYPSEEEISVKLKRLPPLPAQPGQRRRRPRERKKTHSTASPAQLTRWVQLDGYTGWFAPSREAYAAAIAFFRQVIREAREKAQRTRKTESAG